MKDLDKLFDDLFAEDFDKVEAEPSGEPADASDARQPAGESSASLSFLDEDDEGDDPDNIEDTEVGGSFDASCPYCGEAVSIFLDPAGGSVQDYVEDCSVCCQPMTVSVRFSGEGQADVMVDTTD